LLLESECERTANHGSRCERVVRPETALLSRTIWAHFEIRRFGCDMIFRCNAPGNSCEK
jgi:hypothetical protein